MANRPENYKDKEKYKKTCYFQKKRYYEKTAIYPRDTFTMWMDDLILAHTIPDSELSKIIKHSVAAIQGRRYKLKHDKA